MTGQQLKNSILQLAIQGKLVPQNPDDESASELLKRIRAEKEKLVKEKKIKKEKPLPEISEDEKPFEIPEGWVWCRLGEILRFVNGRAYKKEELLPSGKYKVLRVGNFFTNDSWYYSNLELEDEKYCSNGDLLYAWSASFGPKIWLGDKTIFHYHIWNVKFAKHLLYRDYLYYFLLNDVNIIKKSTTGSTMVHVSMENMIPRLIPLPPLQEQHRIVEKIEELMPLVDEYDKAQKELNTLNANLPEALKKSILQEAIQGKLGTNNPADESASELLKRIRAEKEKLVKEKKIKKEKPLPEISEDEKPFDIPDNWVWCRLGEILRFVNGRAYKKEELLPSGKYKVLRVGNFFTNDSWYYSNLELEDEKYCSNGDLLYAWSASFGPKIWLGDKTIFHYHIWNVKFAKHLLYRDYLYYFLLNDVNIIKKSTTGSTMVHVSMENMIPRLIPLPPLQEQHRIVEKLNELLPKLETLK